MGYSVFQVMRNLVAKASQPVTGRGSLVLGRDDANANDRLMFQDASSWRGILSELDIDTTFAGTAGKVPDSAAVKAGTLTKTDMGSVSGTINAPSLASAGFIGIVWGTVPAVSSNLYLPAGGTYDWVLILGGSAYPSVGRNTSGGTSVLNFASRDFCMIYWRVS